MSRENAPVTLLLGASLIGAYFVERTSDGAAICADYGFIPAHPTFGAAVASLFLHDPSSVLHLGGNLVFLFVFGTVVERALGSVRFSALYLSAGLGGAALHCFVSYGATTPLVGASGAICGLLAVAGVLRPRLLGFVFAFIGINVFHALTGADGSVSFAAHLGGFAIGALFVVLGRSAVEEARCA